MRIVRWCGVVVATVALPLSQAGAVASDASTANQITTANGLSITIDTPDTDNDDESPDGRLFCTRYDDGTCVPLNKAVCDGDDSRTVTLELSATSGVVTANSRLFIFATRSACTFATGEEPDDSSFEDIDLSASSPLVLGTTYDFPDDVGGTMYASASDIAEALGLCSTTIDNKRYRLCFSISVAEDDVADSAVTSDEPYAYLTFLVDNVPPDAPTDFSTQGGDSRVFVHAGLDDENDEVTAYHVRYRETVDDGVTDCSLWTDYSEEEYTRDSTPDDAEDFTIDGFTNGQAYQLCAAARDNAGNLGAYSEIADALPVAACGFIGCYPGDSPTGYCGDVGPSTLAMLLCAATLASTRRRRIAWRLAPGTFVLVFATAALAPSTARAEDWSYLAETDQVDDGPAQWGLELRFGPYRPQLSSDAQRDVYDAIYTDKTLFQHHPIMFQLEFDWYFINTAGLGGLYGRAGYWKIHGHTRVCATEDDPTAVCTAETIASSERGVEKDALYVIPLEVGIVYRVDQFKRTYGVPLVPYAKAGLVYDLWWSKTAGEAAVATDGTKGRGGSPGFAAAAGLAVSFGWLGSTRSSAADLDRASFFVELDYTNAGLRKSGLNLSDTNVVIGLGLEFP